VASKAKAEIFDLNKTLRHGHGEKPKKKIVKKLKKAQDKGEKAIVISTESEKDEQDVKHWLGEHHINPDELIMRPKSDAHVRDYVEKSRIIKQQISPKYDVTKAYDDKPENVRAERKLGIKAKRV
jgi:hypothetical protein